MEVGKIYRAVKPAESFGVIDGEMVKFDEVSLTVEVLNKPSMVFVDDGVKQKKEPLPQHLQNESWQLVKNLETFKTHWFFVPNYIINEIRPTCL